MPHASFNQTFLFSMDVVYTLKFIRQRRGQGFPLAAQQNTDLPAYF